MEGDAPPARSIALVGPSDYPRLAPMLARAFQDDPVFNWMLPDRASRLALMTRLFSMLLRLHGPSARIIAGPDGRCASIWQPPGTAGLPFATMAANAHHLLRIFGLRILRALAVSDAIEAHFPAGQFWYVHFVGVEPDLQGQGWGRTMMREGLGNLAAPDALPTYLETARPENVAFYTGLGFTVIDEWDVPNGPHFWSLLHQP